MKSMKRWITVAAMLLAGATVALAQEDAPPPPHGPHGGPPPSFTMMFAEKLALTDAQKSEITAIEKATRDENASFFASSRTLMEEFHAAREANDTAKLESLKPSMDANREQMKKIRDAQLVKIEAVLTADQKAKFEALRAEHDAHRPPPRE
jgi:Spy/CpxP family protein refolding chaperone